MEEIITEKQRNKIKGTDEDSISCSRATDKKTTTHQKKNSHAHDAYYDALNNTTYKK